jgi:hypothetical protein
MIRDWAPYALPRSERKIIAALAEALYDPFGAGLSPIQLEIAIQEVVDDVELWLGAPDVTLRTAMRAMLLPIEVSPVRHGFGPRRMSDLPLEERIRYVAALHAADSVPLDTWKSIIGMAYFARPVGAAHMDLVARLPHSYEHEREHDHGHGHRHERPLATGTGR